MSPSEQKIYDAVNDFRTEQASFNATIVSEQKQMRLVIYNQEKAIHDLEAIRDKAIGAFWLGGVLGGSGFLAGIGALIYSFIKK